MGAEIRTETVRLQKLCSVPLCGAGSLSTNWKAELWEFEQESDVVEGCGLRRFCKVSVGWVGKGRQEQPGDQLNGHHSAPDRKGMPFGTALILEIKVEMNMRL